jgi:hypothetical protein
MADSLASLDLGLLTREGDDAKTDLALVCAKCGATLCDAEEGDSLALLAEVLHEHLAACPRKEAP